LMWVEAGSGNVKGLYIHKPVLRRSAREWLFLLGTRRFWHRLLWGP
jgi:hypothetical protein